MHNLNGDKMREIKLKPKEEVTTHTYKRMAIQCPCGETLDVDYEDNGKICYHKETWCTQCNRYYSKTSNDEYVFGGYKCFNCHGVYNKLYMGIDDLYSSKKYICEKCLEKFIKNRKEILSSNQKELDIFLKKQIYKPGVLSDE